MNNSSESRGENNLTIKFGPHTWIVLERRNGKALLLSEDIIEKRAYNDKFIPVTWETCAMRKYLNGEFLERFLPEEQTRIALTRCENPDNTWGRTRGVPFGTPGGNPTDDRVFLLSIEEILRYFPGLKLYKDDDGDEWSYELDERLAAKLNGSGSWWWLRSPGLNQRNAAYVRLDGDVTLGGLYVGHASGGVRPALWINLESGESSDPPNVEDAAPLTSTITWHETASDPPPEDPGEMYLAYKNGNEKCYVLQYLRNKNHTWHWLLGGGTVDPPDYWAELPEPPTETEKE